VTDRGPPVADADAVREAFRVQGYWCDRLGSPFTARLCALLADRLDDRTALGRRILNWPGKPGPDGDSVPLRLTGALHALVRRGGLPRLAALYPPNPQPDDELLWSLLSDGLQTAEAEMARWLDNPPQTNEVARSALLMAGLAVVADATRLPLALYELGASAGLNLVLDRYGYRLGALSTGPADAPVVLSPPWKGPPPPDAPVHVLRRRGVDRAPLDVTTPADAERLVAYIWPDQAERLARMVAAIHVAAADPPPIDRADAADWLEAQLGADPEPGAARVVMHSIAFQYFPQATRQRIVDHLVRVGGQATAEAPLAWLAFELDSAAAGPPALRLTLWPGGNEWVLAHADPHVRAVEWLGKPGLSLIG
jgi:hypothetical protein